MTRDEHTTNRPTPGGSVFQETGMDDYLTSVAEAVRDACAETCNEQHTIAERRPIPATICAMHIGHIDLPAIIASVPRPEPVAAQVAVPHGWKLVPVEPTAEMKAEAWKANASFSGEWAHRAYRAMLAAAPEAPQPDDDDFELTCPEPPARDDRKAIKRLSDAVSEICFQSGESEDEFTKWLADGGMLELLESSIKAMKLEKAVEAAGKKNAALVAAMQNIADEFVPGDEQKLYGTPTDVLDRIRSTAWAALASAKGGAE